jgi:flagellar basal body P-ring formation protein FlgA
MMRESTKCWATCLLALMNLALVPGRASSAPVAGADRAVQHRADTGPVASAQWITSADLHAEAVQALKLTFQGRVERLTFEPVRRLTGVVVPGGTVVLAARPLPTEVQLSARMSVWVDVRQDGRVLRSVLVPVEVHAFQQGWRAVRDLPAGSRLGPGAIEPAEVDIAISGHAAWNGKPLGQVLRSRVLSGTYVGNAQVAPAATVRQGDRIELVLRGGGVEVRAEGTALQDGEVGQEVQVRVEAARGPVLARVVASGKVEWLR